MLTFLLWIHPFFSSVCQLLDRFDSSTHCLATFSLPFSIMGFAVDLHSIWFGTLILCSPSIGGKGPNLALKYWNANFGSNPNLDLNEVHFSFFLSIRFSLFAQETLVFEAGKGHAIYRSRLIISIPNGDLLAFRGRVMDMMILESINLVMKRSF